MNSILDGLPTKDMDMEVAEAALAQLEYIGDMVLTEDGDDSWVLLPEDSDAPHLDEAPGLSRCHQAGRDRANTNLHYSTRGPADAVVSGPIINGWGPGRWFATRDDALEWARGKYGPGRVEITPQSVGRWSVLVRGLKCSS